MRTADVGHCRRTPKGLQHFWGTIFSPLTMLYIEKDETLGLRSFLNLDQDLNIIHKLYLVNVALKSIEGILHSIMCNYFSLKGWNCLDRQKGKNSAGNESLQFLYNKSVKENPFIQ